MFKIALPATMHLRRSAFRFGDMAAREVKSRQAPVVSQKLGSELLSSLEVMYRLTRCRNQALSMFIAMFIHCITSSSMLEQ